MDLRCIAPQPEPGLIHVVVEVPAGGRNKYEYLPSAGLMALDRVLHPSVQYPFDYGFVPNTLAEDGSPLDAMVVMEEPSFPGCLILARPIGLLELLDAGGSAKVADGGAGLRGCCCLLGPPCWARLLVIKEGKFEAMARL